MAKMKRKIVVISNWKSKTHFQQLKKSVESHITDVTSFFYLCCVEKPKAIENLPHIPNVYYLSKKDFSLLGKVKTDNLRAVLLKEGTGFLIVAMEEQTSLLTKTLKQSKLRSVGVEKESLPDFDLSFKNTESIDDNFFKKINNYITKIQL